MIGIRRMLLVLLSTALMLTTTACFDAKPAEVRHNSEQSSEQSSEPSDAVVNDARYDVLAEKLRTPWDIAVAGDTIYISEREGQIVQLIGTKLSRQSVVLSKNVHDQGEGGFLGFVLAPVYNDTKLAYAYHTYKESGEILNRVVLLQQSDDKWKEIKPLLESIPGSFNHNGGRMRIGPDRKLYITTGDAGKEELAQNLYSLAGKILRMELDGSVPEDNPYPESYVYSYGHRNPQGIVWNEAGEMYAAEHGPSGIPGGHDEINKIVAGGNYGWPSIIGDEQQKDMLTPIYHTGKTAIAPSGIDIDADGQLLIAALRGEALYRYDIQRGVLETLLEGEGRIRSVSIHNGEMYIITNNTDGRGNPSAQDDRLLRLK